MMQTVAETSAFSRRADAMLTREERDALIDTLAANPLAGVVVVGLGGVRKLRWAPPGRGKSGAFRVIYYVVTRDRPILALFLYGKNEQADLNAQQRQVALRWVAQMKGEP